MPIYNAYAEKLFKASIDLSAVTVKLALTTSAYVPDEDNHEFFSDITNEIVASGYPAGGVALANVVISKDPVRNSAKFDADNITLAGALISATRYGILYVFTGVPTTSDLLAYIDFLQDQSTDTGFLLNWDSIGVLEIGY